jgi:hypothetical protein
MPNDRRRLNEFHLSCEPGGSAKKPPSNYEHTGKLVAVQNSLISGQFNADSCRIYFTSVTVPIFTVLP